VMISAYKKLSKYSTTLFAQTPDDFFVLRLFVSNDVEPDRLRINLVLSHLVRSKVHGPRTDWSFEHGKRDTVTFFKLSSKKPQSVCKPWGNCLYIFFE
jgi:hypothetical protein